MLRAALAGRHGRRRRRNAAEDMAPRSVAQRRPVRGGGPCRSLPPSFPLPLHFCPPTKGGLWPGRGPRKLGLGPVPPGLDLGTGALPAAQRVLKRRRGGRRGPKLDPEQISALRVPWAALGVVRLPIR